MNKLLKSCFSSIVFLFLISFVFVSDVSAHCDTMDGPVVNAGRKALNEGNVNYALIWVKPESEDKIRKALKKALRKRKTAKTKDEKEKIDMEFFESLVKIHRAGEGAGYEGIKPAGSIDHELEIADSAVDMGKIDEVLHQIQDDRLKHIVSHLFQKVQKTKTYDVNDISSGREFIDCYVKYIHAVEGALKGEDISKAHNH